MFKLSKNFRFCTLLFVVLALTGCETEDIVVSNADEQHWIFLGIKGDPLYAWMNNRSAICDPLVVGLGGDGKIADEGVNYDEISKKCINASRQVTSYESRLFLKDFISEKVKDKDYVFIEWYIEYEKPGKFEVEQTAWAENVADRWITLGNKHYFLIREWFEDPDGGWRSETNKMLTLDKYIYLMRDTVIDSAAKYRKGEMEFVVLKYTPKDLKAFGIDTERSRNINYQAEIWIDEDFRIVAASLTMRGINTAQKTNVEYRQLFAGYNRYFGIRKPKDVLWLDRR